MKDEKEIQTAWEIWILINRLSDLLFERYEEDFPDIDPYEQQDPCLAQLPHFADRFQAKFGFL